MSDDGAMTLHIKGREYTFSSDDITLGEAEWLEDEMGVPLADIDFTRPKPMARLALMLLRRENPQATLEDARGLRFVDFDEPEGNGQDPTRAASEEPPAESTPDDSGPQS